MKKKLHSTLSLIILVTIIISIKFIYINNVIFLVYLLSRIAWSINYIIDILFRNKLIKWDNALGILILKPEVLAYKKIKKNVTKT